MRNEPAKQGIVIFSKYTDTGPIVFEYKKAPSVLIMPMAVAWGDETPPAEKAEPETEPVVEEESWLPCLDETEYDLFPHPTLKTISRFLKVRGRKIPAVYWQWAHDSSRQCKPVSGCQAYQSL